MTDRSNAPNPFDPDSLRITGDISTVGAEKVLLQVPVRKPSNQEYFRVISDTNYWLTCAVLEMKADHEFYVVTPDALHILAEDVKLVDLRLCLNRMGTVFFWPVPVVGPDGRTNSWHESSREVAKLAVDSWLRMVANMSEGGYSVYRATGNIPDPVWPDKTMAELLELTLKDGKRIDSEDHPIVQQLRGWSAPLERSSLNVSA